MVRVNYQLDPYRDNRLNMDSRWGEKIFKPAPNGEEWINYKGYFSFDRLYKRLFEYIEGEIGYKDPTGNNLYETYYFENRGEEGFLKELWAYWRLNKIPDKNKMFKYRIEIDIQILGMSNETIMVDGQKIKTNYGEISFFVRPYLDIDIQNKSGKSMVNKEKDSFKKDEFLKHFADWFEKRMYSAQIDDRKNEIYNQVNGIVGCIKNHLGMVGFQGFRKDFHPEKGVPQYKL